MKKCEFCSAPEGILIKQGTPMLGWIDKDQDQTPFTYTSQPHYMIYDHWICDDCVKKAVFAI